MADFQDPFGQQVAAPDDLLSQGALAGGNFSNLGQLAMGGDSMYGPQSQFSTGNWAAPSYAGNIGLGGNNGGQPMQQSGQPMQQSGQQQQQGGDQWAGMGNYLTSQFGGSNGVPVSQQATGMGNAAMSQLMQQAGQGYQSRLAQYNNLMSSMLGPKGSIETGYKQAKTNLGRQQQQALGQEQQSLTSRGLGNSTIADTMQGGINRNYGEMGQNLYSDMLNQTNQAKMGMYQMNPNPTMQQYASMLGQFGNTMGGAGAQVTSQRSK